MEVLIGIIFFLFQEKLLGHLGVVLYEYLGEEYPEVLGSILGALKVHKFHISIDPFSYRKIKLYSLITDNTYARLALWLCK
jgi:hypothetical protein